LASREENKQQQEQNALLAEAKKLITDINRLKLQLGEKPISMTDREAVANVQTLRRELRSISKEMQT